MEIICSKLVNSDQSKIPMKKTFYSVILLSIAALMVGCGCEAPPFPTPPPKVATATPADSTEDLVVYLDTSLSMAGYVSPTGPKAFGTASPNGKTIFQRSLMDISYVVTTMKPQPNVWVRTVDTTVSSPVDGNIQLSGAAINPARFAGKDTDLVSAIKAFAEPLDAGAGPAPPRFHLLVTDGVQSKGGSNPFFIRKNLTDLMNAGWGGAVLGIRSEFSGKVFRELMGGSISYASGKDPSKFRPFYIYVFSPDRAALEVLVSSLRERLQGFATNETLRVYPLTAPYSSGSPVVEVQPVVESGYLDVQAQTLAAGYSPEITVLAHEDLATTGKKQFSVTVRPEWSTSALAAGSPEEVARTLKWEFTELSPNPAHAGHLLPEFKMIKDSANSDGTTNLTFEVGWPLLPEPKCWSIYRVVGKVGRVTPWITSWDTNDDSSVDDANKTLNIASSLDNLWQNSAQENHPVVEFHILVGPQ